MFLDMFMSIKQQSINVNEKEISKKLTLKIERIISLMIWLISKTLIQAYQK